jgi:hypothetical protein
MFKCFLFETVSENDLIRDRHNSSRMILELSVYKLCDLPYFEFLLAGNKEYVDN